jgi:hypothetical protein
MFYTYCRSRKKDMKMNSMNVWFAVFAEFCDWLADFPGLLTLKKKALSSFEMPVSVYPETMCHTSDDCYW